MPGHWPASLLMSCSGLLIGQTQSKAYGKRVSESTQLRFTGQGAESRGAHSYFPTQQSLHPPEKGGQSPISHSCLFSPLLAAIWREKCHERPKKHPFGPEAPQLVPHPSPQSFAPGSSGAWQLPIIHVPARIPAELPRVQTSACLLGAQSWCAFTHMHASSANQGHAAGHANDLYIPQRAAQWKEM